MTEKNSWQEENIIAEKKYKRKKIWEEENIRAEKKS